MKLIYSQEKGHLGQYEDWYHLDERPEAGFVVVHTWDHVTVGTLARRDGTEEFTPEEFLEGNHPDKAKEALKKALER